MCSELKQLAQCFLLGLLLRPFFPKSEKHASSFFFSSSFFSFFRFMSRTEERPLRACVTHSNNCAAPCTASLRVWYCCSTCWLVLLVKGDLLFLCFCTRIDCPHCQVYTLTLTASYTLGTTCPPPHPPPTPSPDALTDGAEYSVTLELCS